MIKKTLIYSATILAVIILAACQSQAATTEAISTSLTTLTPGVPGISTPTVIPTQMAGQLAIITYQMKASPELEPMLFTSVQGRKFSYGDFSLGDTRFPDLSFFDDMHYCMKNDLDGAHLVACQEFNQDGTKGWVKIAGRINFQHSPRVS